VVIVFHILYIIDIYMHEHIDADAFYFYAIAHCSLFMCVFYES
jgi:hypothetical protein